MKKLIISLFALLIIFSLNSQTLESRIPNTSKLVIAVNGEKITDKVPVKKLNQSAAFIDFAKHVIFEGNENLKIDQIGADLKSNLYFFYNSTDNLSYYAYLYEISKLKDFEKYVGDKSNEGTIVKTEKFNIFFYNNERGVLAWNNEYALYLHIDNFFYNYDDFDAVRDNQHDFTEFVGEESVEESDSIEVEEAIEEVEEDTEVEENIADSDVPETTLSYEERMKRENELRQQERLIEQNRKKEILINTVSGFFSNNDSISILNNTSYSKLKNDKSDVFVWLNSKTFSEPRNYWNRYYGLSQMAIFSTMINQYFGDEIYANLYFKSDKIVFDSNIQYAEELTQVFSQIYSSKLPSKFLDYVDPSTAIGISSMSLNSQKLLESYPKMYATLMKNAFGSKGENYSEEVELAANFISILLDEKALGDLVTGDALLVLKDIKSIDVEYTTFKYNSDHTEYKEVTKTKKEQSPEFLIMIGTRNKSFMEQLLDLGCKHKLIIKKDQYYLVDDNHRDIPFKMFFTIQNDIVFISTNSEEIELISTGKFKSSIDSETKSKIMTNQGYMYLDLKTVLQSFDAKEIRRNEPKEILKYSQENIEQIEIFTNYKSDRLITSIEISTPKKAKNSALYIWDFINALYEIEEKY